jgi:hypothetical protein
MEERWTEHYQSAFLNHCEVPRFFLHASEQNLTWSQTFAHFFRHEKGRLQTGQIFTGRFGFL